MNKDNIPEIDNNKIACQQILAEDHSVFSLQMVVIPAGDYPELASLSLLHLYLNFIHRVTLGLIQPVATPAGIQFLLAGTKLTLIEFSLPQTEKSGESQKTTICICGGILVQPKECDRGQLDFIIETIPAGRRIILQLSDYCPLLLGDNRPSFWRKLLYRLTQAYIHKVVTIRFIANTYREITGRRPTRGVVSVAVRQGRKT